MAHQEKITLLIHSHFIINSVSFETGKKLHQTASAIQEIRQKSDALCLEYGLSVCRPKGQRTKPLTAGEYHTAVRGGSWKMQLINTVDKCMRYARSKDMFIEMIESEGYVGKIQKGTTRKINIGGIACRTTNPLTGSR